ncbi:uncharacterized protein PRCAT00005148001 [Priceomyces carsonii]|uniref:uncharacterized protein n=1 Tax=Priceomyces carsonii TaxID=28549 RepID=UPI002ED8F185|nr:unnamed protein product [Priceomyces carsonii]
MTEVLESPSLGSFYSALEHAFRSKSSLGSSTNRFYEPKKYQPRHRDPTNPFNIIYGAPYSAHQDINKLPAEPPTTKFGNKTHTDEDNRRSQYPARANILDQGTNVKTTGSIISRSASVRNRNHIKERNHMVKKQDLISDQNDELGKSRKPKKALKFSFPVKRKTSLKRRPKYRPLDLINSKFNTIEDLQSFWAHNEVEYLQREMLPKYVQLFEYARLMNIQPVLKNMKARIQFLNRVDFEVFPHHVSSKIITHPHDETLKENNTQSYPRNQRSSKSFSLVEAAFARYKDTVFNRKANVAPKFNEVYDDSSDQGLLTSAEMENVNRRLLWEVLLRRTIAAKIQYRLSHNSFNLSHERSHPKINLKSYSPKTRPSDFEKFNPEYNRETSLDTTDIMQHNASLISGMLPSPQLSDPSDIFGSLLHRDESLVGRNYSNNTRDKSQSPTSSSVYSSPQSGRASTKEGVKASPELLFINNFNKTYFAQYGKSDNFGDGKLVSSSSYRIKPINRSVGTLSSSEISSDSLTHSMPFERVQEKIPSPSSPPKHLTDKLHDEKLDKNTSYTEDALVAYSNWNESDVTTSQSHGFKRDPGDAHRTTNMNIGSSRNLLPKSSEKLMNTLRKSDNGYQVVKPTMPVHPHTNDSVEIISLKGSISEATSSTNSATT